MRVTRPLREQEEAEVVVTAARSHLRLLIHELEQTLARVESKADRMAQDAR